MITEILWDKMEGIVFKMYSQDKVEKIVFPCLIFFVMLLYHGLSLDEDSEEKGKNG